MNFSLYPKLIAEILTHIPTIGFKMVKWSDFIHASRKVISNYKNSNIPEELVSELSNLLPDNYIIAHELDENLNESAQDILRIYFLQFQSRSGLFLDLRANHFSYQENTLKWKPNALIYQFEEDFRIGIINMYKGFYHQDEELFKSSLNSLGLTAGLNEEKTEVLVELFYSHFGQTNEVSFAMDKFQQSFLNIFEFFLENKMTLKTDFLFLGVYLVTLYMHLQKYKNPINVEEVFLDIFPVK